MSLTAMEAKSWCRTSRRRESQLQACAREIKGKGEERRETNREEDRMSSETSNENDGGEGDQEAERGGVKSGEDVLKGDLVWPGFRAKERMGGRETHRGEARGGVEGSLISSQREKAS